MLKSMLDKKYFDRNTHFKFKHETTKHRLKNGPTQKESAKVSFFYSKNCLFPISKCHSDLFHSNHIDILRLRR